MTTLAKPRLEVKTINSHHQGADFGVVLLEDSDTQLSIGQCLNVLAKEGWTSPQEVDCDKIGVHKFLLTRKK